MNLAPIALFVYNRPAHTLKVLNSIAENELSSQSTLFIFSDGAKTNASNSDLEKISEVRKLITENQWCANVKIEASETNRGLANSIIDGLSTILLEYDRCIVLEDDIVVSKYFLEYMNLALDLYHPEDMVAGVSAFTYPNHGGLRPTYFLPIGCSWGWATWSRSWNNFEPDARRLLERIEAQGLTKQFDFGGYQFFYTLELQSEGKLDSWAIRFYASFFLKNQLFLFPEKSYVKNIGFDNSGSNTGIEDTYFNTKMAEELTIEKEEVVLIPQCVDSVKDGFEEIFLKRNKTSLSTKIKTFLQGLFA